MSFMDFFALPAECCKVIIGISFWPVAADYLTLQAEWSHFAIIRRHAFDMAVGLVGFSYILMAYTICIRMGSYFLDCTSHPIVSIQVGKSLVPIFWNIGSCFYALLLRLCTLVLWCCEIVVGDLCFGFLKISVIVCICAFVFRRFLRS